MGVSACPPVTVTGGLLVQRPNATGPLFYFGDDRIDISLTGYAVVPVEDYRPLSTWRERWRCFKAIIASIFAARVPQ